MTPFVKFHGFGNDYIVASKTDVEGHDLSQLAQEICHRHTGAGADGIAVVEKLDGRRADFFCEIVNPDGSIAGFSGNGTRCAVSFLYFRKLWSDATLRLETRSGVKNFHLSERIGETGFWFDAEIGMPKFASADVPINTVRPLEQVVDHAISVDGRQVAVACVNVGNPVACTFVDHFEFDWRTLGRLLEIHEVFPQRANIVFVKVLDGDDIEIRIWERGVGETSSSGTCCSGAAVLCALTDRTSRKVSVHTTGGITKVDWRDDGEILLTGRADLAYVGEWPK
ncbi:MAG TPA: diaminopimelate epimerase [Pyrinomonadaceae bacterium]|nr:diaminopimelate epimerase [Pyrinomonadaceae bacterium]